MRIWVRGIFVAMGLAAGLAVASASAQDYTASMDANQWHRLWDHFAKVQHQIDFQVQSGVMQPGQAFQLEKQLKDCEVDSLWQRFEPNGNNHNNIWADLHHIHQALGGNWDREFDRF